jgi:hypothetical protein
MGISNAERLREWKKKNPEKHQANYERWTMKKKSTMYQDVLEKRKSMEQVK